ncbi:hypothetical protein C0993_001372 [Termitomyces sp. T159_Od127]|nr:hypothetical protein C0993_001372 [Termitomyces sp. T159_Od127]
MNLENFPRIALYNANPITLLGRGIQCIYEGSFAWLAIATHPLFAGDYYMEDDVYPDPLSESLLVPPWQIPPEQKLVALPIVASNFEDRKTEHPQGDNPAFLHYWRPSSTENSDRVPEIYVVTERPDALNVPTPSTPPAVSVCPSEASTLPSSLPDYEDEAQTTHEEPVHLLTLPSLPLEHTPWPEQHQHYLSPLKSPATLPVDSEYPTSEQRKRRSRKSVHILEPEPRKRTRRHFYESERAEDSSSEEPTTHFHSEHSHVHPYHHRHHPGRHQKSRRKDRIYDRAEADTTLDAPSAWRSESPPSQHLIQLLVPHPRHTELPSPDDHHRNHQRLRREEKIHDRPEILAENLEAPSPDRRDESSPPERLVRPPTPHPRHIDLPNTEEHFYAEADEFLNHMAEQLFQAENTLRDLKREECRIRQEGNSTHDAKKKDRKERRRENKQRRSAPYTSRPIEGSTSLHEYRDPPSERRRSKTRKIRGTTASRKARTRGTTQMIDDIGTLGLGMLTLAQPQARYADTYAHLVRSSLDSEPRSLNSLRPELNTSQRAESSEGVLQLGSFAAAFPAVNEHLDDGELSVLFQGVQLDVGSEASRYQKHNEVPPSITVEENQQWNDVEDLGNILTQVKLDNEAPEQEQTRPLTIRIPSMAQLQARIARNATVVQTPPSPPAIE